MNWEKLLSNQRIKKSKPTRDIRNPYESDYGRIIFSPALRRMHDKTQVFPLSTNDNIHTRLTHSNEVMSIGYTFGLMLSENEIIQNKTGKQKIELLRILPVLLQNTCFIHDIGNTPFGHFGETIISDYFKNIESDNFNNLNEHQKRDFTFYDGNAQGLRVLTKLQYLDNPYGLNLTFATLGSYLKYPNYKKTNKETNSQDKVIEKSKHGVFFSEKDYFNLIIKECELEKDDRYLRHPLCYLMEASDSIAYLCMDMEDGFNKGIYDINFIKSQFNKENHICNEIIKICDDKLTNNNTKIVNIRIKLISYFVKLAFKNFMDNLDLIENGNYNKELIEDDNDKIYKIVKSFSNQIFKSREINFLESTGFSVITGLLNFYINFLFNENKNYTNRAKSLISKSIIQCAIEENLVEIGDSKLSTDFFFVKKFKDIFKEDEKKYYSVIGEERNNYGQNKIKYLNLLEKQKSNTLTEEENDELNNSKKNIFNIIEPKFEDLNDYYKFRIIVDFISGMTDKFAVTHFQKISGQKIN